MNIKIVDANIRNIYLGSLLVSSYPISMKYMVYDIVLAVKHILHMMLKYCYLWIGNSNLQNYNNRARYWLFYVVNRLLNVKQQSIITIKYFRSSFYVLHYFHANLLLNSAVKLRHCFICWSSNCLICWRLTRTGQKL